MYNRRIHNFLGTYTRQPCATQTNITIGAYGCSVIHFCSLLSSKRNLGTMGRHGETWRRMITFAVGARRQDRCLTVGVAAFICSSVRHGRLEESGRDGYPVLWEVMIADDGNLELGKWSSPSSLPRHGWLIRPSQYRRHI